MRFLWFLCGLTLLHGSCDGVTLLRRQQSILQQQTATLMQQNVADGQMMEQHIMLEKEKIKDPFQISPEENAELDAAIYLWEHETRALGSKLFDKNPTKTLPKPPTGLKFKEKKKKPKTLLETSTSTQIMVQGHVRTRNIGVAGGITHRRAREQIRNNIEAVPLDDEDDDFNILWEEIMIRESGGPLDGRIREAGFMVSVSRRYKPGVMAVQWCNALYHPTGYANHPHPGLPINSARNWFIRGMLLSRPSYLWQVGHIQGSALGGDDVDPLNFFPQHRSSNADGSVWWRAERIAQHVQEWFDNNGAACDVDVFITFVYPHATLGENVPNGGTYEIRTTTPCRNQINGAAGLNQYQQAFVDKATPVVAVPAAAVGGVPTQHYRKPGHSIRVNWRNQPDGALRENPAAVAGVVPAVAFAGADPNYSYQPLLFAN